MRMFAPILAVMAAALLVSNARPQERTAPASKDQADESVKKVKELQKERIAVLKKLVDHVNTSFHKALVGYDEVLEAMHQLSEAELEAAETDKERVEICKNLVDALKKRESLAEAGFKSGRVSGPVVLKATAKRLEAEIRLERVKMKVAPANPKDGVKPPAKQPIEAPAQKIKALQKERIAALEGAVGGFTILIKVGRDWAFDDLIEARLLLLQAELNVAEKGADRISLYKKAIDALKQYEEMANTRVQAGRTTKATVLKIKAQRLEVEIQLGQAKVNAAMPK